MMKSIPKAVVVTEIDLLAVQTGAMLRGRLTGFRVEMKDEGVILRGTARSFYIK